MIRCLEEIEDIIDGGLGLSPDLPDRIQFGRCEVLVNLRWGCSGRGQFLLDLLRSLDLILSCSCFLNSNLIEKG